MAYVLAQSVGLNSGEAVAAGSGTIHYGAGGDDTFTPLGPLLDEMWFFGGSGNDTYNALADTTIFIYDAFGGGGGDVLNMPVTDFDNLEFASVEGHFLIHDAALRTTILILNGWNGPGIESIVAPAGVLTAAELMDLAASSPGLTWAEADAAYDLLPDGVSIDEMKTAIIDYTLRSDRIDFYGASDGDDSITGLGNGMPIADIEIIEAFDGDDIVYALDGFNAVLGGAGNDVIYGGNYADILYGGTGDDMLVGNGSGTNVSFFSGGPGDDQIIGGSPDKDDVFYSDATGGVTVNLALTSPQFVGADQGTDTLSDIENLFGSAFDDTLVGDDENNQLGGFAGADILAGGSGDDLLIGGEGNDAIFGGAGSDEMTGEGGDDIIYLVGAGDNVNGAGGGLSASEGYDMAIVLDANGVTNLALFNFDYVAGNNGNDVLRAFGEAVTMGGAGGDDMLRSDFGDDIVAGGSGADEVHAGDGADLVFGGTGVDALYGDGGDDLLYIVGNDGVVDGGAGFDRAVVLDLAGVTVSLTSEIEYCAGNSGNDSIDASALLAGLTMGGAGGADTLVGSGFADIIAGGTGNDVIRGGGGNDNLIGGDNDDVLFGGAGTDLITFGTGGVDVAVVEGASGEDYVFGFEDGVDTLDFSAHTAVNSFADLVTFNSGADAWITFDGGQILVVGGAGLIEAGDFTF